MGAFLGFRRSSASQARTNAAPCPVAFVHSRADSLAVFFRNTGEKALVSARRRSVPADVDRDARQKS
jgi:hypothetical protein